MSHLPPPPPEPTPQRASTHIALATIGVVLAATLFGSGVITNTPTIGAIGVLVGLVSLVWLCVAIILAVVVAAKGHPR